MAVQHYLAVDLGAESGRVMLGSLDGGKLTLTELHRFGNGPLHEGESLRWNFSHIVSEVKRGMAIGVRKCAGSIAGAAVNSWGVDFGLLDDAGELIENPYHYRDRRTDGMLDAAFKIATKRDIYERTGIQFMQINTLYQLFAMRRKNDPALKKAKSLLFMADLVAHSLCGKVFAEYTLASTSQIMDMREGKWSKKLLKAFDLPADILPDVVKPATVLGNLTDSVAREIGCKPFPVIAAASHDTADAVAAVPAGGGDWAYLSSGTWSLLGVELPKPVITDASCEYGVTNEGGVEGTIRFLKNIAGLWLLQECRRHWQSEGHEYSYSQLAEMARTARKFAARIDPDCGDFLAAGNMPERINRHLKHTGQNILGAEERGELVRSILECLAFTYRDVLNHIEEMPGRKIKVLHIVGGGSQNELLNQFAADATGREVIAGPVEATSIGNILLQARALGQLKSLEEIREVVRNSFQTKCYAPSEGKLWEEELLSRSR